MPKTPYTIVVSGDKAAKRRLLGALVDNSANLTNAFFSRNGEYVFFFRFRSDARLVLNRLHKSLSPESAKESVDSVSLQGARARIAKA